MGKNMDECAAGESRIISRDEIFELLKRYDIGKKPLARLLGWGETTIIRYTDGGVPTREYSERLSYLLKNPVSYYEFLMENRGNITNVAFEKSRKAVEKCVHQNKIVKTAQAIINEAGNELGVGALQFLCYYVQVCHLYFYGIPMFEDEYSIEINFCPYPGLKDVEQWYFRVAEKYPMELNLSGKEKQLIKEVVFAFRWYGPETMRGIMANERNFLKVTKSKEGSMIITHDTLKEYFDKAFGELDIQFPKDFGKYVYPRAREIIHE